MPAIRIREGEEPISLDRAVTLRDFLTITRDIDKAMEMMREKCLEGRDEICAAYKAQVEHYARTLMGMRAPGERGPVEALLRRMGKPEYELVLEVEDLWKSAEKEYPDIVESEGRAGPEFLEEELAEKWEEKMKGLVGSERWRGVEGIYSKVREMEKPEVPDEEIKELEEAIEAEEEALEAMRAELREKMDRLKE